MRALAWDDKPNDYMAFLARQLYETYAITVEVTSDFEAFQRLFTESEWDFVLGDIYDEGREDGRAPIGLELARLVADRHQDLPVFLLTRYHNMLTSDDLALPPSIVVKSKSTRPVWMAGDIVKYLKDIGCYVDRRKVFLIYGHDREAEGALERVEHMLMQNDLEIVRISEERLSTEIASGLLNNMNSCAAFIAICTPDDRHEDGSYHPRQNVILEIGMALGLSRGLQRMTFLQKWGTTPEQKALLPSDLYGVITIRFETDIDHAFPKLLKRLTNLGVQLRTKAQKQYSPNG